MDVEMKEMFGMILSKLDSLDNKVTENSSQIESIQSDVTKNSFQIESIQSDVTKNSFQIESIQSDVTKNSIQIESIQSDMKTIVEVQKNQYKELYRKLDDIFYDIKSDISLHSTVLKNISTNVKALEQEVSTLKRKIG